MVYRIEEKSSPFSQYDSGYFCSECGIRIKIKIEEEKWRCRCCHYVLRMKGKKRGTH